MGFEKQFNLIEQIGKGAMAKVYLIERIRDRKKFAAKIVSLTTESEKSYVKLNLTQDTFINETKILRVLANPHIVFL